MNLELCFKIFDIDKNTSREDIKRIYRDLVAVWHPDRFSHNPRLKSIAEKKLKEVNSAYRFLTETGSFSDNEHVSFQVDDKRTYIRKQCHIITVYTIQKRPFQEFQDTIVNISGNGIFIETERDFIKDQKLSLSFTLPLFGELTHIAGKIIRCTEPGIGVQFNMSDRYQKMISNLI